MCISMIASCTFLSSCNSTSNTSSAATYVYATLNSGYKFNMYDTSSFELTKRLKQNTEAKKGIYYEIFVRSFADSDGDGIGDLNGITEKLDYLKDLGVEGIWLTPINSCDSYHGYDVTDYKSINSQFGTEEDFKNLLSAAHSKGIKVIMDYVINHTSIEHPWFKEAITAIKNGKESDKINYYRFVKKDDALNYNKDDKSPWNTSVWHSVDSNYAYYGVFSEYMPDLNYNNPNVREEIKSTAKKWLDIGVDGFRLDACMHIYGDHEFNQMSNQTEANVQWWNEFASYCETINPSVYLVGEAWQGSDVLPAYVQPFDSKFNFAFAENLINCVKSGTAITSDGENISVSLKNILDQYGEYDTNYIDAIFGTNHDQNRIMSEMNNADKAKLTANIYMTLAGNPYIYYGEELGMYGAKPDENIREPFKWSTSGDNMDTTWEAAVSNTDLASLEEQKADTNSMYNHYKNLIKLRNTCTPLRNGTYQPVDLGNGMIMAYERATDDETIYVIHNLSSATNIKISNDLFENGIAIYSSNEKTQLNNSTINLEQYSTIIIKTK